MFYLSTSCSSKRRINEVILELVGIGANNIELSGDLILYDGWQQELERLKEQIGLNLLIHNYFPPPSNDAFVLNLASQTPGIRQKSFALIRNAFSLMNDLAIPLYSIHSGFNTDIKPEVSDADGYFKADDNKVQDKTRAQKIFYENLDQLMRISVKGNQRLAVENLFPYSAEKDYSLMAVPSEIQEFMGFAKNHENLGLLLDLGHLNVAAQVHGFKAIDCAQQLLSDYPDKVFELHLSENDGSADSHKVNKSDSWQLNLLEEYYSVVEKIPVVFEWQAGKNSGDSICQGFREVKEKFNGGRYQ